MKPLNKQDVPDILLTAPTIWSLLQRRIDATPDAVMLVEAKSKRILGFRRCGELAERLAATFHAAGIRRDSLVTWQFPTGIDAVLVSLALARIGAIQNPVIHLYRERELRAVLTSSNSSFLIGPSEGIAGFPDMARALVVTVPQRPQLILLNPELPQGDPGKLPPPVEDGEGVRWIYYTSGTTSEPKGVCHTDAALMQSGRNLVKTMDARASDVGSVAYPYAHIGGILYTALQLAVGMSAVLFDRFVPTDVLEAFRTYGVVAGGGSTPHYLALLEEQRKQPGTPVAPTLRVLSGGGAPKPPDVYYDVLREMNVKVVHNYGMTEAPLITTGSPAYTDQQLASTEGTPSEGVQIRIVREDGSEADPGESGEVRVRGVIVCKGYTDPALTAAAFDNQGFFRTGDLGALHGDGHLTITGRLKDIIIRKGENISAKEIEELLFSHPKVTDVAVIGLPDPLKGERVCAVVEQRTGTQPLSFDEMVAYFKAANVMLQKIPEQLEIVDCLPRNETLNKVLKQVLRARYANASSDK
jgi:acyl-CoA synthetase (AMP-forming)/AMP-acid ligase II